jgi:2-iminobutanoate/2-iminopropanoate deaminase
MPQVAAVLVVVLALAGCRSADRCRGGESDGAVWHLADAKAKGPYSGAAGGAGLVFLAGKIGNPAEPFAEQARGALAEVERQLREAGSSWPQVLSVTVYLTDMGKFAEFNGIYGAAVGGPPFPARGVAGVSSLPAGAQVMVQVVASSPGR